VWSLEEMDNQNLNFSSQFQKFAHVLEKISNKVGMECSKTAIIKAREGN